MTKASSRARVGLTLLAFVAFLAMPLGAEGMHSLSTVLPRSVPAATAAHMAQDARQLPVVRNLRNESAAPTPKVSTAVVLAVLLFLVLGFVLISSAPTERPAVSARGAIRSRAPPVVA